MCRAPEIRPGRRQRRHRRSTAGECLPGDVFSFDPALVVDGEVVVRIYNDGFGDIPALECRHTNDRAAAALAAC